MLGALLQSDAGEAVLGHVSAHDLVCLRQVCRGVRAAVQRHVSALQQLTVCARIHAHPLDRHCPVPSSLLVSTTASVFEVLCSLRLDSLVRLALHCTPANLVPPRPSPSPVLLSRRAPTAPLSSSSSSSASSSGASPKLPSFSSSSSSQEPSARALVVARDNSPCSTPSLGRWSPFNDASTPYSTPPSSPLPLAHRCSTTASSSGSSSGGSSRLCLPNLRSLVLVLGSAEAGGAPPSRREHSVMADSTVLPLLLRAVSGTLTHLEVSPTSATIPAEWLAASLPPLPGVRALSLHRLRSLPPPNETSELLARFPSLESLEVECEYECECAGGDGPGDSLPEENFEGEWEACRTFGETLLQALRKCDEGLLLPLAELHVTNAMVDVARLVGSLPHLVRLVWVVPDIVDEVWLTDPDLPDPDLPVPPSLRCLEIVCPNLPLPAAFGEQLARTAPHVQFLSVCGLSADGSPLQPPQPPQPPQPAQPGQPAQPAPGPGPTMLGAHLLPLLSALDALPSLVQLELGLHWPAHCEDDSHVAQFVGLFSSVGGNVEELALLVAWECDSNDDGAERTKHRRLEELMRSSLLRQCRQLRSVCVRGWTP